MGKKPDPETIRLQEANLKNFRAWMKSKGHLVMPIPGRSVVYAGFPNTEFSKMRRAAIKAGSEMVPMWKAVEAINKLSVDQTGMVKYDSINDVLKRLKSPLPKLFATINANRGHPVKFANMLDVANALCSRNDQLLPKGDHKRWVWDELSALYVANSKGEIDIFEGNQKVLKQIDKKFTLANRELTEILKNKDLGKDTHAVAQYILDRYRKHHQEQASRHAREMGNAKRDVLKAAKG